jgi:hypothetical protein
LQREGRVAARDVREFHVTRDARIIRIAMHVVTTAVRCAARPKLHGRG